MKFLRKGLISSVVATTALISGSNPTKYYDTVNECGSAFGYAVSTQYMQTNSIAGTYDIETIHAMSMLNDGRTIMDEGKNGVVALRDIITGIVVAVGAVVYADVVVVVIEVVDVEAVVGIVPKKPVAQSPA